MIIGAVVAVLFFAGLIGLRGAKNVTEAKSTSSTGKALHQQALKLKQDGQLTEARDVYKQIIAEAPDYEMIETTQAELGALNLNIIKSNIETPQTVIHEVQSGDTLGKIAKKYGTTIELIKISNNLSSNVIRVGQKLRVWTGSFNIFVDKSQNILILRNGEDVVKVYRVSTGTNNNTPIGAFVITTKLVDPVWFKSGAVIPPESPQNVLGTRWLGFDLPGYGIHGTIEPNAIGQQVTAGCVRMINQEVEELYDIVPIGTQVKIVD